MPSSPVTKSPVVAAFVCECETWARSACVSKPYKKAAGKNYCVLHYPGDEKGNDFARAIFAKLQNKDFNFRGAVFVGEGGLAKVIFSADASFYGAVFHDEANFFAATFEGYADFRRVQFRKGIDIRRATFRGEADFRHTTFVGRADFSFSVFESDASFFDSDFEVVKFIAATFKSETEFRLTSFRVEANFSSTTFEDYVTFRGEEEKPAFGLLASLILQFARVMKPSGMSFHTVNLRPLWFINVDSRTFEFINVNWYLWDAEVRWASNEYDLSSLRLLEIACRNLAVNAEDNHRYEEASRFRYMAMEARRLEHWQGFAFWTLRWWYWLASGYGERVWRAFVMLIVVWLLAAALYTQVGFVRWEPRVSNEQEVAAAVRDEVGEPLRWQRALTYSLGVMTLQKPEPRPATNAAQGLLMLETILGPVQAALLALAIRRKFMR